LIGVFGELKHLSNLFLIKCDSDSNGE
jgi:hypothetical protein